MVDTKPEPALLPCPYCGGSPHYYHSRHFDLTSVQCANCDIGTRAFHIGDKVIAATAWNRRSYDPTAIRWNAFELARLCVEQAAREGDIAHIRERLIALQHDVCVSHTQDAS